MKQTLADALARKGYDTLTPVQQAVSDPDLEGRDLVVSAQTGSGKTIGFGLAIAPNLLGEADVFETASAPLALVIAPTRELAMQVKRELGWLYADANAFLASCVGGMDMRDERRALARGAHIVVATPGRLRDHIMRGSIDLTAVRAVVLDEADEMLDLGFREDLEFILEETPAERQTLLFSATVPTSIASLATRYQNNAERINTVGAQTQHADIEYRALMVAPRDEQNAIINVLRYYEAPNSIVFCNTRAMVARLTARLSNRGFSVVALSGELSQAERSNALQAMRDGRARICVATDVAARGIDLPNLDLVVHAELPGSHETLLHRSGRTGRAQRKGVSALIVAPSSRKKAERILKFARLKADWAAPPSADEVAARDTERMLADEGWQTEVTEGERAAVDQLMATFSPEQLAVAYLRQYQVRHSAPEELGAVQAEKPKPRQAFGPSVWFSVSEGRNQNASPRHLLPMLCKAGNLSKDDFGAIRIADDVSYVELREASAAGFLAALGPAMQVEGDKDVVRLDAAPDLPPFERPNKPAGGPKGKPRRPKPAGRAGDDWGDAPKPKPRAASKPKRDAKPVDDASYKAKPKAKPASAKPERAAHAPRTTAPKTEAPKSTAPKKDAPRAKPKPPSDRKDWSDLSEGRKPRSGAAPRKPGKSKPSGGGPRKPARHGAASKSGPPQQAASQGPGKGPPPPKGKPSSKKNRARAAVTKGGEGPMKRRKG